jgi:hypothetical protein
MREGVRGIKQDFNDGGGSQDARNVVGIVTEYALAKHYGPDVLKHWVESGQAYTDDPSKIASIPCDVGKNLHVRGTSNMRGGLILRKQVDRKHSGGAYVLAILNPPETDEKSGLVTYDVDFVGWNYARNLMKPEFWRDTGRGFGEPGRAAYCVPQDSDLLLPMDTVRPEDIR